MKKPKERSMFSNPFSPIFGGKPDMFFGRSDILRRFELAMANLGSDERAFFFTGTRGSGKTALLEQLSMRAAASRREVIDLGPEDTIAQLVRLLAGFDEVTKTVSPQAGVSAFGFGASASGGSVSKTKHANRESLQALLLDACAKAKHGLLVTVDEIQKVPVDDISALCSAFQMASRKGNDIMLAVAGLPYSHTRAIEYEGCTYLRRAAYEELGLFTWDEAANALKEAFSRIEGLVVGEEIATELNRVSYGQPYLMQLLGYHLVARVNEGDPDRVHMVSEAEMSSAVADALAAYERGALKPLFDELSRNERDYLRAMAERLDEGRLAKTSDVAAQLGVPLGNTSHARARLMGKGVIAAPEHGKVMFCIPYLADYVLKDKTVSSAVEIARSRRV